MQHLWGKQKLQMVSYGMEQISLLVTKLFALQPPKKRYSISVTQVFDCFSISPQSIKIKFSRDRVTGDILPWAEPTSIEKTVLFFCVTKVMEDGCRINFRMTGDWQPRCSYKAAFKINHIFKISTISTQVYFIFLYRKANEKIKKTTTNK